MDTNIFIRRAELFMPGVAKHLKVLKRRSRSSSYAGWTSVPTDMVCGETKNYKIVVTKWQFNRILYPGDTIYEWLKICFAKKDGKVRHFNTRRYLTKSWKDPFMEELSLNYAQLKVLEKDTIEVSWVDENGLGHDKLSYVYNLNKQLN